jgi:gluconate 2-dehydrogenase subunit 3-like protein
MMESRRGLLKKSIGGVVLLSAAASVPVALRKTKLRATRADLKFFSAAEYSIWAAVADRILARDETPTTQPEARLTGSVERPPAPTAAEIDVAAKADAFLAPLPAGDAKDLKQLLALFDNALFSLLTGGPATPFTQMSAAQQDAHLRAWQTSRLAIRRTGFQAMKRLCAAIYFGSPETFASVGYPGPPYELVKTAALK